MNEPDNPGTDTLPSPPVDPLTASLTPVQDDLHSLRYLLAAQDTRLARLEATLEATAKQVGFLPPQLRLVGSRVDALTTSVSEPRFRALLLSLLGVYDLVEQMLRTLPEPADVAAEEGHRRNYEVLRTQLRQLLATNGLSEIVTEGTFDPAIHRALQRVPCADPEQANRVLEVVRPGFRTEQVVLRYAEVVVGQYVPPNPV